jgi:hypothetical protein
MSLVFTLPLPPIFSFRRAAFFTTPNISNLIRILKSMSGEVEPWFVMHP